MTTINDPTVSRNYLLEGMNGIFKTVSTYIIYEDIPLDIILEELDIHYAEHLTKLKILNQDLEAASQFPLSSDYYILARLHHFTSLMTECFKTAIAEMACMQDDSDDVGIESNSTSFAAIDVINILRGLCQKVWPELW
jgi:hypothetical protein